MSPNKPDSRSIGELRGLLYLCLAPAKPLLQERAHKKGTQKTHGLSLIDLLIESLQIPYTSLNWIPTDPLGLYRLQGHPPPSHEASRTLAGADKADPLSSVGFGFGFGAQPWLNALFTLCCRCAALTLSWSRCIKRLPDTVCSRCYLYDRVSPKQWQVDRAHCILDASNRKRLRNLWSQYLGTSGSCSTMMQQSVGIHHWCSVLVRALGQSLV